MLPLVSKYHNTGTIGMMYIMFPQFPRSASVAASQSGQYTARTEVEMGPKVFHTIPCVDEVYLVHGLIMQQTPFVIGGSDFN
jgi:hypothetical protein